MPGNIHQSILSGLGVLDVSEGSGRDILRAEAEKKLADTVRLSINFSVHISSNMLCLTDV